MMACLNKLKADIKQLELTFPKTHDKFMRSKLVTSIYYAFMSNYAFCSQYEDKNRSLLIAIEKIFMRWDNSTLTEEVKRICDEILIK